MSWPAPPQLCSSHDRPGSDSTRNTQVCGTRPRKPENGRRVPFAHVKASHPPGTHPIHTRDLSRQWTCVDPDDAKPATGSPGKGCKRPPPPARRDPPPETSRPGTQVRPHTRPAQQQCQSETSCPTLPHPRSGADISPPLFPRNRPNPLPRHETFRACGGGRRVRFVEHPRTVPTGFGFPA